MTSKLIPLILTLTACGHFNRTPPEDPTPDPEIQQLWVDYLGFLDAKYTGPTIPMSCDATLLTALYVISGGQGADTTVFEDPATEPGLVYRTETHDCYKTGRSKSECSRDMYLGWTFERFLAKDAAALERVVRRAIDRKLVMCEGLPSRTLMSPALLYTIHRACRALGGCEGALPDPLPAPEGFDLTTLDFTDHLQVLHIWFRSVVEGGATAADLEHLADQASEHPRNALFAAIHARYTGGDQERARKLTREVCPAGRLPTVADRCEPYLWQRDDGADWEPCPGEVKAGHGVDCVVVMGVVR